MVQLRHVFGVFPLTKFFYGDGTRMAEETIMAIRTARWSGAVVFPLIENDIHILDNLRVQHGRTPYGDPKRSLRVIVGAQSSEGKNL